MSNSDIAQSDLAELLTVLDMGDHARPQSPHEVFQEALGVLRQRLAENSRQRERDASRALRRILKRARWIGQLTTAEEHCARAVYESREDAHEAFRALAAFRDARSAPSAPTAEARRAETGTGSVHEDVIGVAEAPQPDPTPKGE